MKTIRNISYNYYWGIFLIFFLWSCEDFVEVDPPASELASETVFDDVATADAAMAYIYSSLQSRVLVTGDSGGITILMGAYADELTSYSNYGLADETFYLNSLQADNATVASLWSEAYNLIYAANSIIEGVTASDALSDTDRDRLCGEALFVRSYIYYYLIQLFGDIPYVTGTDYTVNQTIGKTVVSTFYNYLIADLQQAKDLLPENYFGANRVRPNRSAAAALLARVCLFAEECAMASENASQVINNTAFYSISEDLDNVFLIGSPSIIWQLMPSAAGMNTLEGQNLIFSEGPPPVRALSESLFDSFSQQDLRREHWIGTVTNEQGTWHYPFKYKQPAPTGNSMEYSIQLRLEEMFLIRAEARAMLGEVLTAQDDLNVILQRAGLPLTQSGSTPALITEIMQQRQLELFCELGHRFFDLKRLGLADALLQEEKPGWNTQDQLLPYPQRELQLNPNLLPQNTGY